MIKWNVSSTNPVISPGLNGELDAKHAGSSCILESDGTYLMYYWGIGSDGVYRICRARSLPSSPNEWCPLGSILESQPNIDYNAVGPSFPYVVVADRDHWLLYFGSWGRKREDGKLPNRTGVAQSNDGGETWEYVLEEPVLPLDREYDTSATGSVCVLYEDGVFRMYYTSIGAYFDAPEGVQTGHGRTIPKIGVAYAESTDGLTWTKPLDALMVSPRGFDTEPYEYIASKPWVIKDGEGYRMWVSTFGHAYRIRSLTSDDGMTWEWIPSDVDGDLGVGLEGNFDDHQRCYASVIKHGDEYRCWYTGNGFGRTGIGYAVGTLAD